MTKNLWELYATLEIYKMGQETGTAIKKFVRGTPKEIEKSIIREIQETIKQIRKAE